MQINLRSNLSRKPLFPSVIKISFIKLGKIFLCQEDIRTKLGLTVQIAFIRGARASTPLFAIIPRLFFPARAFLFPSFSIRIVVQLLLSHRSPFPLKWLAFQRCLRLMVPSLVLAKLQWRDWSSLYSLIRIEIKGHSLLVGEFTNRARHWPGAARTRIHSKCACWVWWSPCCAAPRCRSRCYRRSHRMSAFGCCRTIWQVPGAEAYDVSQSFDMCLHWKISLGVLLKFISFWLT